LASGEIHYFFSPNYMVRRETCLIGYATPSMCRISAIEVMRNFSNVLSTFPSTARLNCNALQRHPTIAVCLESVVLLVALIGQMPDTYASQLCV